MAESLIPNDTPFDKSPEWSRTPSSENALTLAQMHATFDRTPAMSRTSSGQNTTPPHIYATFFDKTPERAASRGIYLKLFLGGIFMIVILIFTFFVIFWGANAKSPAHNLPGWIVVRLTSPFKGINES